MINFSVCFVLPGGADGCVTPLKGLGDRVTEAFIGHERQRQPTILRTDWSQQN